MKESFRQNTQRLSNPVTFQNRPPLGKLILIGTTLDSINVLINDARLFLSRRTKSMTLR